MLCDIHVFFVQCCLSLRPAPVRLSPIDYHFSTRSLPPAPANRHRVMLLQSNVMSGRISKKEGPQSSSFVFILSRFSRVIGF